MSESKLPQEYFFKEGCFIQEWHNTVDDDAMSIARVRVAANTATKLHSLNATTERYVILEGAAVVTVANQNRSVSTGDIVMIEPRQPQKIQNTGQHDLVFLAICTPRFQIENYLQLED